MSSDEAVEESNGDSFGKVKQRFKDRSQVIFNSQVGDFALLWPFVCFL